MMLQTGRYGVVLLLSQRTKAITAAVVVMLLCLPGMDSQTLSNQGESSHNLCKHINTKLKNVLAHSYVGDAKR